MMKRAANIRHEGGTGLRSPHRSAHHALLFGVTQNKRAVITAALVAIAVVVAVVLVFAYTDLNWAELFAAVDRLSPIAVLPCMALLPIVGFPIAIVYLVAGAQFGPLWGGLVVAAATAIHLLGTYAIAKSFLREPLRRFIARKHLHLPEVPQDEQAMVCVIAALVPGLPYVIRNYLLALAGVRLKILLAICVPIYVARSYVTILLGDMGNDPSRSRLIVLVLVDMLKVVICALVIWRLRVHHRKFHADEDEGAPDVDAPPNAAAP
jgi:uncharacterized membrane protein YdjX (TVP38/TMEM64 family)